MRFDEIDSNTSSPAKPSTQQATLNNNNIKIDNGYMIIPGGSSEEVIRERLKQNREAWKKSAMLDLDLEEKDSKEAANKPNGFRSFKGSRNVRKRGSFKEKNEKYKSRTRTINRDSIGHLLDKLNLKKALNHQSGGSSLPNRPGERGTRPDLIQSVLDADKHAGREFTRRPSLEFFQDLRSQLNSGKKQSPSRPQSTSGIPTTIIHTGALRASREDLASKEPTTDAPKRVPNAESINKETEGRASNLQGVSKEIETKDKKRRPYSSSDVPVTDLNHIESFKSDNTTKPIINGANRRTKQNDTITSMGNGTPRSKPPTLQHEPHPQRKIKIPKGFIGILPKYRPQRNRQDLEKENGKRKKNIEIGKSSTISSKIKRKGSPDEHYATISNPNLPQDVEEHYLIRTLPLPTHGSHGIRQDKATLFSSNTSIEQIQVISRSRSRKYTCSN